MALLTDHRPQPTNKKEEDDDDGDDDEDDDVDEDKDDDKVSVDDESQSYESAVSQWITSFALFGDSPAALAFSALIFFVSFFVSVHLQQQSSDDNGGLLLLFYGRVVSLFDQKPQQQQQQQHDDSPWWGPSPAPASPTQNELDPPVIYQYSTETLETIKKAYVQDGVVAVRGLISPGLLNRLDEASRSLVQEQFTQTKHKKTHDHLTTRRTRNGTQFFTSHHGLIFRDPPVPRSKHWNVTTNNDTTEHDIDDDDDDNDNNHHVLPPFLQVAIDSLVPQMAAYLLLDSAALNQTSSFTFLDHGEQQPQHLKNGTTTTTTTTFTDNLRLIRDIFLAKDDDPYICGWHVDDFGFWPATPDSPGINAWIALDTMVPLEHGGGFALAIGSHEKQQQQQSWIDEAHLVTGASTTSPPEGYQSAQDMIDRRTGYGTCNLATSAPHLHQRMEDTKRVYPVERGDVIFHDRWVFHRTIAFAESFLLKQRQEQQQQQSQRRQQSANDNEDDDKNSQQPEPLFPVYRRYSLRYGPGSSTVIPPGYGLEPSVLWDPSNGGKTANEICQSSGGRLLPWYPQAWPSKSMEELAHWTDFVDHQLSVAYEMQTKRKQELKPLLAKLALQQQQQQHLNSKPSR
ncbi:hypothetical protein ACA910_014255 [Epithemia clementina (nom. ined.)]